MPKRVAYIKSLQSVVVTDRSCSFPYLYITVRCHSYNKISRLNLYVCTVHQ